MSETLKFSRNLIPSSSIYASHNKSSENLQKDLDNKANKDITNENTYSKHTPKTSNIESKIGSLTVAQTIVKSMPRAEKKDLKNSELGKITVRDILNTKSSFFKKCILFITNSYTLSQTINKEINKSTDINKLDNFRAKLNSAKGITDSDAKIVKIDKLISKIDNKIQEIKPKTQEIKLPTDTANTTENKRMTQFVENLTHEVASEEENIHPPIQTPNEENLDFQPETPPENIGKNIEKVFEQIKTKAEELANLNLDYTEQTEVEISDTEKKAIADLEKAITDLHPKIIKDMDPNDINDHDDLNNYVTRNQIHNGENFKELYLNIFKSDRNEQTFVNIFKNQFYGKNTEEQQKILKEFESFIDGFNEFKAIKQDNIRKNNEEFAMEERNRIENLETQFNEDFNNAIRVNPNLKSIEQMFLEQLIEEKSELIQDAITKVDTVSEFKIQNHVRSEKMGDFMLDFKKFKDNYTAYYETKLKDFVNNARYGDVNKDLFLKQYKMDDIKKMQPNQIPAFLDEFDNFEMNKIIERESIENEYDAIVNMMTNHNYGKDLEDLLLGIQQKYMHHADEGVFLDFDSLKNAIEEDGAYNIKEEIVMEYRKLMGK